MLFRQHRQQYSTVHTVDLKGFGSPENRVVQKHGTLITKTDDTQRRHGQTHTLGQAEGIHTCVKTYQLTCYVMIVHHHDTNYGTDQHTADTTSQPMHFTLLMNCCRDSKSLLYCMYHVSPSCCRDSKLLLYCTVCTTCLRNTSYTTKNFPRS